MKIVSSAFGVLFFVGIFCRIIDGDSNSAGPVQIVSPAQNHTFDLNLNNLQQILETDEIKNRHAVVVSIAGAFRKGKSFLLSLILRYLSAQVTTIPLKHIIC